MKLNHNMQTAKEVDEYVASMYDKEEANNLRQIYIAWRESHSIIPFDTWCRMSRPKWYTHYWGKVC